MKTTLNVLLIEDSPDDALSLQNGLSEATSAGLIIEWAGRLSEGLDRLKQGGIDVVLLDLTLPDGGGPLDPLSRTRDQAPTVPIIVLSGPVDKDVALEAVRLGAQDVVVKGHVNSEMLLKAISYAVSRHRAAVQERESRDLESAVMRRLIDRAPVCALRFTHDFVVSAVNEAFCLALRDKRENIVGQSLWNVLPTLDLADIAFALGRDETYVIESCVLCPMDDPEDQRYFDLSLWPIAGEDGSFDGGMLWAHDVTVRVRASKHREDLIGTLAHDLKVPLVGADRMLELFTEGVMGENLSSTQKELLSKLRQSNQDVLWMIHNILQVHRSQLGEQIERERTDLCMLINKCVHELQPFADTKRLLITKNLPAGNVMVLADRTSLRRVVTNLVHNAIKYTDAGGTIDVSVEQDLSSASFSVRDTGCGIAMKDQPHLYKRFWQAKIDRRVTGGHGLGLYVCKKIVEAHNGTIECFSRTGVGTIFTVRLPRA